MARTSNPSMIC